MELRSLSPVLCDYRLAFGATYTDRRSTFDDFGIEGLGLGATLTYIP